MGHTETTMLAATLQRLTQSGLLDVRHAAESSGLDSSAIYKWIAGQRDPSFTNLKHVFMALGRDAQLAILGVMSAGTGWIHTCPPGQLDLNGDGDIDTDDALDAIIGSLDHMSDSLKKLRKLEHKTKPTDTATAELCANCDDVITRVAAAKAIVQFLNQRDDGRRAARMTPAMEAYLRR